MQSFYRAQVSLGSDLWVLMSVCQSQTFADLIDVTLADEVVHSIPTKDVNASGAIWWPTMKLMQVAPLANL